MLLISSILGCALFLLFFITEGKRSAQKEARTSSLVGGGTMFIWLIAGLFCYMMLAFELLEFVLPIDRWRQQKNYLPFIALFLAVLGSFYWLTSKVIIGFIFGEDTTSSQSTHLRETSASDANVAAVPAVQEPPINRSNPADTHLSDELHPQCANAPYPRSQVAGASTEAVLAALREWRNECGRWGRSPREMPDDDDLRKLAYQQPIFVEDIREIVKNHLSDADAKAIATLIANKRWLARIDET